MVFTNNRVNLSVRFTLWSDSVVLCSDSWMAAYFLIARKFVFKNIPAIRLRHFSLVMDKIAKKKVTHSIEISGAQRLLFWGY